MWELFCFPDEYFEGIFIEESDHVFFVFFSKYFSNYIKIFQYVGDVYSSIIIVMYNVWQLLILTDVTIPLKCIDLEDNHQHRGNSLYMDNLTQVFKNIA